VPFLAWALGLQMVLVPVQAVGPHAGPLLVWALAPCMVLGPVQVLGPSGLLAVLVAPFLLGRHNPDLAHQALVLLLLGDPLVGLLLLPPFQGCFHCTLLERVVCHDCVCWVFLCCVGINAPCYCGKEILLQVLYLIFLILAKGNSKLVPVPQS
jgi:hypothetical protein